MTVPNPSSRYTPPPHPPKVIWCYSVEPCISLLHFCLLFINLFYVVICYHYLWPTQILAPLAGDALVTLPLWSLSQPQGLAVVFVRSRWSMFVCVCPCVCVRVSACAGQDLLYINHQTQCICFLHSSVYSLFPASDIQTHIKFQTWNTNLSLLVFKYLCNLIGDDWPNLKERAEQENVLLLLTSDY